MTSREDTAADVFSRLGAGPQDPVPGGSIREYSGKVKTKCEKTLHFLILNHFGIFSQVKLSNPLNCTHVVEGHSNSVLAIRVHDNNLYSAAAGELNHNQITF